tara:strand:+ start:44280 stop:48962 length:4683 start_codon:yes stop_codon:yes gene_type:complete
MTVYINGKPAIYRNSGAILTNHNDVCYKGPNQNQVTYTNVATSATADNCASTVFINGQPACHKNSIFKTSKGDKSGDHFGVISGTVEGQANFVTASPNVFIEGIPAVRHGDLMVSNNHNTPPAPVQQPGTKSSKKLQALHQAERTKYPVSYHHNWMSNHQTQDAADVSQAFKPVHSVCIYSEGDKPEQFMQTMVNSEDNSSNHQHQHILHNLPQAQTQDYLTIPQEGADECRIPLGQVKGYNSTQTLTSGQLAENQLLESLLAWRITTPTGELDKLDSITRLPAWLREQVYLYRIWHYRDYADNKQPWTQVNDELLAEHIQQYLTPSYAPELDPGWLYVFRDGYLWRELEVVNVEPTQKRHYKDVDLMRYAGAETRAATTVASASLAAVIKTAGKQHDIQIAYSPVQWSWDRVTAMGGMDDNDERAWKNHERLSAFAQPKKSDADALRQKRMGPTLQLANFLNQYVAPSEQCNHTDEMTGTHCMVRDDNIPTLFLDNPLGYIASIQTDISFLWQQLKNAVAVLPYQAPIDRNSQQRMPNTDVWQYLFANPKLAWKDISDPDIMADYVSWCHSLTATEFKHDLKQKTELEDTLKNHFSTAVLANQLFFNPVNNQEHEEISFKSVHGMLSLYNRLYCVGTSPAGNQLFDMGRHYLNKSLIDATLDKPRRNFIKQEIRRLQTLLIEVLNQQQSSKADNAVDTQEALLDYFAMPASQYGRGYFAMLGILNHTAHDPRMVDQWLDNEAVQYAEVDIKDHHMGDVPGEDQTQVIKGLPNHLLLPFPAGGQWLKQLVSAKAGDQWWLLKQAMFPSDAQVQVAQQPDGEQATVPIGTGLFNPTAFCQAYAITKGDEISMDEHLNEQLHWALQGLIQLGTQAWQPLIAQALNDWQYQQGQIKINQTLSQYASSSADKKRTQQATKDSAQQAQQAKAAYEQALDQTNIIKQQFLHLLIMTGEPVFKHVTVQAESGPLPANSVPLSQAFLQDLLDEQAKQHGETQQQANPHALTPQEGVDVLPPLPVKLVTPNTTHPDGIEVIHDAKPSATSVAKTLTGNVIKGTLLLSHPEGSAPAAGSIKPFTISQHTLVVMQGALTAFALWDLVTQTYSNLVHNNQLGAWIKTIVQLQSVGSGLTKLYGTYKGFSSSELQQWMQVHSWRPYAMLRDSTIARWSITPLEAFGVACAGVSFATAIDSFLESFKTHDTATEIAYGLQVFSSGLGVAKATRGLRTKMLERGKPLVVDDNIPAPDSRGIVLPKSESSSIAEAATTVLTTEGEALAASPELAAFELPIDGVIDLTIMVSLIASQIIMLDAHTPLENWARTSYFNNDTKVVQDFLDYPSKEYATLLSLVTAPTMTSKLNTHQFSEPAVETRIVYGFMTSLVGEVEVNTQSYWHWQMVRDWDFSTANAVMGYVIPARLIAKQALVEIETNKIVGYQLFYAQDNIPDLARPSAKVQDTNAADSMYAPWRWEERTNKAGETLNGVVGASASINQLPGVLQQTQPVGLEFLARSQLTIPKYHLTLPMRSLNDWVTLTKEYVEIKWLSNDEGKAEDLNWLHAKPLMVKST